MKIDSWRQFLNKYSKCSQGRPSSEPSYSEMPLRMFLFPTFLSTLLLVSDFFRKKAFFIISMVSSTGTFVKSDSTSIEIIKFSSFSLISLTLFKKSNESFNVYWKRCLRGRHWLLVLLLEFSLFNRFVV